MLAVASCSDQSKVEIVNHFMYALITTLHQYYIVVVYLSARYVLNKLTLKITQSGIVYKRARGLR